MSSDAAGLMIDTSTVDWQQYAQPCVSNEKEESEAGYILEAVIVDIVHGYWYMKRVNKQGGKKMRKCMQWIKCFWITENEMKEGTSLN